jgi:hypothetical protein
MYGPKNIQAGRLEDLVRPEKGAAPGAHSAPWFVIDMGFSARNRTCGIWMNGGAIPDGGSSAGESTAKQIEEQLPNKQYGMLAPAVLTALGASAPEAINIMIEAPLSMAFTPPSHGVRSGNPVARFADYLPSDLPDRQSPQARPWYIQPAAGLILPSVRLLIHLAAQLPGKTLYIFEGFVSFKNKRRPSDHKGDVEALWNAIPEEPKTLEELAGPVVCRKTAVAESALPLHIDATEGNQSGSEAGIPPILRVDADGNNAAVFSQSYCTGAASLCECHD